ncbi:MAG: glucose-6-phosphate isomerase family protein, partial [Anaerolineae bacterium]|nr:glucose-6-phosphate isomerase family protein [Anaerolineae bacterium]
MRIPASRWQSIVEPWTSLPTTIDERAVALCQAVAPHAGPTLARAGRGEARARGMRDLSAASGLPLWLDEERSTLVLAQPNGVLRGDPQPAHAARAVLLDPEAPAPEVLYWVFRDVVLPTDADLFRERGLRHNLLLLPAGRVGQEYIKTWGHQATSADGSGCPEAYGVLRGKAFFLLQRPGGEPARSADRVRLSDVRCIQAEAGGKVAVPAGYGVVVANVGDGTLLLS